MAATTKRELRWITIDTTDGPVQVQATVYGNWAVNRTRGIGESVAWSVTYIPVGLCVESGMSREAALSAAEQLHERLPTLSPEKKDEQVVIIREVLASVNEGKRIR